MKNSFFKNCLALFLITLIAGVSLAAVNEITKEPIANAEIKARMDAYNVVYPDAQFKEIKNTDAILQKSVSALDKASLSNCSVNDILEAFDNDGNSIGYVMTATSSSGYGGDVQIAVGISSVSETITGFSVLSHSETAGLGAKCTDAEFKNQFNGKSTNGIVCVKTGASSDTEIDAISGATITSSAVTEAVNSALTVYSGILKEV